MNIVKRGKEKNLLLSGGAYRRRSGGVEECGRQGYTEMWGRKGCTEMGK